MAGGNLSPRQKMINLMYLVFIAMLAMNMSKEVLSAFGFMNEKLSDSNTRLEAKNKLSYASLEGKAKEQAEQYAEAYAKTDSIRTIANDLYTYIQGVKDDMMAGVEDPKAYESMDKTEPLDILFFKDGKASERGQTFVKKVDEFRKQAVSILGNRPVAETVKERFNTDEVVNKKDGITRDWLSARYEGFPMVASLTNLTQLQSDIRTTEADALAGLLQEELSEAVSMTNYEAMVVFEKSAYYAGEQLNAKIVLGKKDAKLKAHKVVVNGRDVPESQIQEGQVIIKQSAGAVGDREIKGTFTFMEDGKEVPIEITGGKYAVIPRPNEAVISADKMNVVYRGLPNPMTISIPGIPGNKVNASASGLRKKSGNSYIMTPGAGKEVSINVSGKMSDGKTVTSNKKFRIKDIPAPVGSIRGQSGLIKMPKTSLSKIAVGVALPDFVFDLKFNVTGFSIKMPGQSTIKVSGARMNGQAQSAIARLKRGDVVSIFNIKSKLSGGGSYRIKDAAPVNVEIQ